MPELNLKTTQQRNRATLFLDYTSAELRKGKDWIIVYYVKNPLSEKLERQRIRVPKRKSLKLMEREAKRIVDEINRRLQSGWNPYLEKNETFYAKFEDVCNKFLNQNKAELQKSEKREDTYRSYKSFISIFKMFLAEKAIKLDYIFEFNKKIMSDYLDYIYYERSVSNRTYNNHLNFFSTFFNWLIKRGFVSSNICDGFTRKKVTGKQRTIVPEEQRKNILLYLYKNHFSYFVLVMLDYKCFIRRTELTKLKVRDIRLSENLIIIRSEISKNKKEETVTIPNEIVPFLAKHLQKANNSDFVFSNNEFKPGINQLTPKKISDYFTKIRKILGLPKAIKFYSWKDTGITELFEAGLPSIKIRNQARHYDLKITEIYTHRNKEADPDLKNINLLNLSSKK